uniref:Uncharacterized protein n=1 Tax=Oryza punctata TaxID=4537 RepID=A0A0E0MFG1_ORYPU
MVAPLTPSSLMMHVRGRMQVAIEHLLMELVLLLPKETRIPHLGLAAKARLGMVGLCLLGANGMRAMLVVGPSSTHLCSTRLGMRGEAVLLPRLPLSNSSVLLQLGTIITINMPICPRDSHVSACA